MRAAAGASAGTGHIPVIRRPRRPRRQGEGAQGVYRGAGRPPSFPGVTPRLAPRCPDAPRTESREKRGGLQGGPRRGVRAVPSRARAGGSGGPEPHRLNRRRNGHLAPGLGRPRAGSLWHGFGCELPPPFPDLFVIDNWLGEGHTRLSLARPGDSPDARLRHLGFAPAPDPRLPGRGKEGGRSRQAAVTQSLKTHRPGRTEPAGPRQG